MKLHPYFIIDSDEVGMQIRLELLVFVRCYRSLTRSSTHSPRASERRPLTNCAAAIWTIVVVYLISK